MCTQLGVIRVLPLGRPVTGVTKALGFLAKTP